MTRVGGNHRLLENTENPGRMGIYSMWVAPEARQQGVVQLMQVAEDWAKAAGFTELSLDVTEGNIPAIALYERCGFHFTGQTDRYPNDRTLLELFMLKRLEMAGRHANRTTQGDISSRFAENRD